MRRSVSPGVFAWLMGLSMFAGIVIVGRLESKSDPNELLLTGIVFGLISAKLAWNEATKRDIRARSSTEEGLPLVEHLKGKDRVRSAILILWAIGFAIGIWLKMRGTAGPFLIILNGAFLGFLFLRAFQLKRRAEHGGNMPGL